MGIYIQGYGTVSLFRRKDIAARLIHSASGWSAGRELQDLFYAVELDGGAWLSIYPPAGGIAFEIESGRVAFGTKTSIAGPGYHAALVDLCDHLQADLGIRWRWEAGGDETNYAVDRNFDRLRDDFLDQLIAYSEFYKSNSKAGELHALNLSEGLAMSGYEGVATPLGPMPIQFFLDALDSPGDTEASARQIFPWWSTTLNQEFWLNTLRALLWTEVEWRYPRTPWESHVHRAALALGARFRNALDKQTCLAVDELAALSQDCDTFDIPSPEGIGYRRHPRAFFLPGGWRINLPGYYIEQLEDDGKTICLWFGTEEIRGSSFTIALDEGGGEIWSEELANEPDREAIRCTFRLHPVPKPSESHVGFFDAFAEVQMRDRNGNIQLLILSLFGREENLVPRLAEIAKGVWFDEPATGVGQRGN